MALESGPKDLWSTDDFSIVLRQELTFSHCFTFLTEAAANWKLRQQDPEMS